MRGVLIALLVIVGMGVVIGGITSPIWYAELQEKREKERRRKLQRLGELMPDDCFLLVSGVKDVNNDVLCYYVNEVCGVYTDHILVYACAANMNNPTIDLKTAKLKNIKIPIEWVDNDKITIKWFDRTALQEYVFEKNRKPHGFVD
jgi:hypothetical protein